MKPSPRPSQHLGEVFRYFTRLGFAGFGGTLALVADMQRELVEKRGWMDSDRFVQTFALIKAMPGPVAFQTATFLGRHRAGWRGGWVAAIMLNLPSFLLMILFGIFYQQWRSLQGAGEFLTGMQAAALGVILATLKPLGKAHSKKAAFWVIAVIACALTYYRAELEPVVIVASGTLTALIFRFRARLPGFLGRMKLSVALFLQGGLWSGPVGTFTTGLPAGYDAVRDSLDLFWCCFKSGAFVFGSGLAIVPLMEHDFVEALHWLTHQEFLDALAFGQITPGPVVITATFIGYRHLGLLGAVIGTVAIFMAPFIHMMTWFPRFNERLTRVPWIPAFLTGAIGAVVGAIFATTVRLSMTLENKATAFPAIAAAFLLAMYSRVPVWLLIPVFGIALWALTLIH